MLTLYMNQHVPRAITDGIRLRGVDVITAYEDGASDMSDSELLDRAGELGRVLFTQDDDLIREAAQRQRKGSFFNGVIYAHQLHVSIGACIRDLEIIAKAGEPEDLESSVQILPL
ncbi:MAG: hypothetical protein SCARUB_04856 [Candidatus Scalindua rubra]|uniref:DUF5615 domain-containing protein n=1 Tax=Candidatus Scalindua rubra TaxID=1872076 RepID=A0A1E3X314_9BACT|nr:MAG: hypothetical protein SCARUB_04854 [Candidatus Scalindua rubra]ODS30040.1 MAG: hypothetical protein SCARUB_04856 [Candidatus Scalindua rubra]